MFTESVKNRWRSNKSELIKIFAPAILISSILFLFGPFVIYSGNISEFQISLVDILKYYAVLGIALIVFWLIIGMVIPRKHVPKYISLLFVLGILLWIQGNFLVWEYGLLDGQTVGWSKNEWLGWVDGVLWAFLLVIAFIFSRAIYRISTLACVAILFLQMVNLGFESYRNQEIWAANNRQEFSPLPPKEIYEFSSEQNVIQFILDAFQSDVFQEIVDENPDYYRNSLNGFTFFKETTGSFPTTYMSDPAILSGQNYTNQVQMSEFVERILSGKTIANTLHDNGYLVDLICDSRYMEGRFSTGYTIPVPYGRKKEEYNQTKSALMMDLVFFRHAPHLLKKQIYANQAWLFQRFVVRDALQLPPLSHRRFLQDLNRNMTIQAKKPVYKFIHLYTTHVPIVMNEDCEYAGKVLGYSRKNIKTQCKCGLDDFIAFLERLKSLGCYDNSLIILQADHGAGIPVKIQNASGENKGDYIKHIIGSALPLLAIKPPTAKGPLVVSNAPSMLIDLPATIMAILNIKEDFPGQPIFEIDPKKERERRYYHYKWLHEHWQADFFPRLDEYIINGSVFEGASWRLGRILSSPGQESYAIEKIDFGTRDAYRFLLTGWADAESDKESGLTFNWALGNSSSILVSLPKNEPVRMVANVKTIRFRKPQIVTIKVDQKLVGTWEISTEWEWEKHSVIIGPDNDRPDVSVIEFGFSQYREAGGEDLRHIAVLFESLALHKLGSSG